MSDSTALLRIIARTVMRIEHLMLKRSLSQVDEGDVLAHNDECIRLRGALGGEEIR